MCNVYFDYMIFVCEGPYALAFVVRIVVDEAFAEEVLMVFINGCFR